MNFPRYRKHESKFVQENWGNKNYERNVKRH